MDVVKVWLYAAASVALGVWLAPFIYNAGKALAEVSHGRQINGFFEWLAGICRAAEFPRFFSFSLLIAAGVLFFPAMSWLGGSRAEESVMTRKLRLPVGARAREWGQRLQPNPRGLRQGLIGFLLVSLFFMFMAWVLILGGVMEWRDPGGLFWGMLLRGLFGALVVAVLQELLFRGIALGVFLRAMRPSVAMGLSAVLFALVHFLNPPPYLNVADPDAAGVGFEFLGKILAQLAEPRGVFGILCPLLALGFVLAYARWQTASLFLSVGLHTGWIFVNGVLGKVTEAASSPDPSFWMISGMALHQGLVPLAGIVIAGVLANFLTTDPDAADPSET